MPFMKTAREAAPKFWFLIFDIWFSCAAMTSSFLHFTICILIFFLSVNRPLCAAIGHLEKKIYIFRNSRSTFGPWETPYIIEAYIVCRISYVDRRTTRYDIRPTTSYGRVKMHDDKVMRDSLMKLIWLAIEPDIQSLVDRELGNFSRIPEYHELASELIRLRSQRRATSRRTCQN